MNNTPAGVKYSDSCCCLSSLPHWYQFKFHYFSDLCHQNWNWISMLSPNSVPSLPSPLIMSNLRREVSIMSFSGDGELLIRNLSSCACACLVCFCAKPATSCLRVRRAASPWWCHISTRTAASPSSTPWRSDWRNSAWGRPRATSSVHRYDARTYGQTDMQTVFYK